MPVIHSSSTNAIRSFFLADTFGDGWEHAKLRIYDFKGYNAVYAPSNAANPINDVRYCFDSATAEDGAVVVAAVLGLMPEEYWEVR